jgi:hypothetical protein
MAGPNTLAGKRAVLATMHRKEEVITPALAPLGLSVEVPDGFNSDQFGTFSRDIPRTGSQLEAAKAKIYAAFDLMPQARVGIASEGSFGPNPALPIMPLGRELVLLMDRATGLEITGSDATLETNYSHAVVADVEAALSFARQRDFPTHGLVVMACVDDNPCPQAGLFKNLVGTAEVEHAVKLLIRRSGAAFLETDMRASWNPTRMRSIARAAYDLVRRFESRCPNCDFPGYDVTERIFGLPCSRCGEPTEVTKEVMLSCSACDHRETRPVSDAKTADPGLCNCCNP